MKKREAFFWETVKKQFSKKELEREYIYMLDSEMDIVKGEDILKDVFEKLDYKFYDFTKGISDIHSLIYDYNLSHTQPIHATPIDNIDVDEFICIETGLSWDKLKDIDYSQLQKMEDENEHIWFVLEAKKLLRLK